MRVVQSARFSVVLAVVAAGAVSGCRPGTALHSRFNNFRAYYNTYYNAERALEAGEDRLEESSVAIDRTRLVSVFPATSGTGQGDAFQEAIDKSAELLRNRPDSKWADDALLVIGKAYFYQRNLAGAEQKFKETIEAAALADEQRLGDEAAFWLGRTYAAMNRFDEGIATLEGGIGRDGVDRRWAGRMQIALGELYARARRWQEAADALEAGAPTEGRADVAARAYVLLGQVDEHLGRFEDAAESYRLALRQKPAYELAFSAELGRALVLGLETDRAQEGLRIVRRMRGDDKHYQRRAELALVEARIRARLGPPSSALALYRDVLYDEELGGGAVRGEAHYRLSEFYRDVLDDYVRASAHLDTAATALRTTLDDRPPARGAVLDVADEARTYSGLAASARRIAEIDSLMALGALPEDAFRARIEAIEAERRRAYAEEQRRLEAERRAQEFSGGGGVAEGARDRPAPQTPTGAPAADAGFLSYRSPASVQSGLITFQQRWGDRPLVPNWRRRAAVSASAVAADRGVAGVNLINNTGIGIDGGPPPLDLFAIPRTPAKRAEMADELAGLRYELANAFFLQLGQADTAAALYRSILDETPDLPVSVRARYALAEIERAAGRDDVARPLYQAVLDADSLSLGRASRERLGLPPAEAAVEHDLSASRFAAARDRWRAGAPLAAAADLVRLADQDPDHPVAPRAYFAAATAYIDWTGADSLALQAPLPDSLTSQVLFASTAPTPVVSGAPARAPETTPADVLDVAADDDVLGVPDTADLEDGVPTDGAPADGAPADGAPPAPAQVSLDEPVRDGLVRDGLVRDGLVRDGLVRDGLVRDGLVEDGLVEDGPTEGEPVEPPGASLATDLEPVDPESVDLEPVDPELAPAAAPVGPGDDLEAAAPDSARVTVADHLRAVAERYPDDDVAERAGVLAAELTPPPVVATPVASDSAAVPADVAVTDSTAAPGVAETDVETDAGPALEDAGGLRGAERLDPDAGGFTWKVRTLSIPGEGASTIDVLQGAGFRSAVLQELETRGYVIAIGQFETEEQARAAANDLPAWARFRGEVVRIDAYARPAFNEDI